MEVATTGITIKLCFVKFRRKIKKRIAKEHEQSRNEKCSNPITLPFDSQNELQASRPKENEENDQNPAEMKELATFEKEKTTEPEPVLRQSERIKAGLIQKNVKRMWRVYPLRRRMP